MIQTVRVKERRGLTLRPGFRSGGGWQAGAALETQLGGVPQLCHPIITSLQIHNPLPPTSSPVSHSSLEALLWCLSARVR